MKKLLTRYQVNRINVLKRFISDRQTEIDLISDLLETCEQEEVHSLECRQNVARGLVANANNQIDYIRGKK